MTAGTAAERLHGLYVDELRQSLLPPAHPTVDRRQMNALIRQARTAEPAACTEPDATTWIWSDLHPGHEHSPTVFGRPFRTAATADEAMMEAWDEVARLRSPGQVSMAEPILARRGHRDRQGTMVEAVVRGGCAAASATEDERSGLGSRRKSMGERRVAVGELEANLSGCLEEVRGGTTLIVTEGGDGVARLIPEPEALKQARAALDAAGIAWSGRRLKKRRPSVRLRGGRSISDIVRENRE